MSIYPVTSFPVHDLNGELLVPADTELTPEFMENLCMGPAGDYARVPLLQHGKILKDLMRQFTIPPYDVIFSQEKLTMQALTILEQVNLPEPLLQGLDYFRELDFHTYRHMLIISALSSVIFHELQPKYAQQFNSDLAFFGPAHDLGKIAIPINVLLKKTPLTHAEHAMLQHHALAGYILLSYYLQNPGSTTARIARDHHERLDGSGYPRGIDQQDLLVEITAVCDIYDALVAQRPYRPVSFDNRSAIEELTWMAHGGTVGWDAVKVLVAYNRRERAAVSDIQVSLEKRGKTPENNAYGRFADT